MLPSQRYPQRWDVDVDISIGQFEAARTKGSAIGRDACATVPDEVLVEELAHMTGFGMPTDRISSRLGMSVDALERRLLRDHSLAPGA
ncbi:hypothetical protein ACWZHB_00870 [Nocardia sp. FBN12]|uniref:hypothetical protein n=1 Tax=Nocardia sp. FBN12 TaxID=3419766 RepID=UPI003CFED53C